MDKYRQLSESNPKNDLGYTLIQWVKRVHDKKAKKNNGAVKGHSTVAHYNDLMAYEVKNTESLKSKASIW